MATGFAEDFVAGLAAGFDADLAEAIGFFAGPFADAFDALLLLAGADFFAGALAAGLAAALAGAFAAGFDADFVGAALVGFFVCFAIVRLLIHS